MAAYCWDDSRVITPSYGRVQASEYERTRPALATPTGSSRHHLTTPGGSALNQSTLSKSHAEAILEAYLLAVAEGQDLSGKAVELAVAALATLAVR